MMRVVVGKSSGVGTAAEELRWEDITAEELATLASTASLLGDTQTFVLTCALAGERGEDFLELAKGLVLSPHTFIFEEEKLLKKPTDMLAKAGVKAEVHVPPKKAESFNMFALAQTFGTRDKKNIWISLQKAARAGAAPEAVAGMLHWKVRDMMSKGSTKYSKEDLKHISRQLVALYHDSHRGAGDLELLLERFSLQI